MAYSVRQERQSLATSLRQELDEAERVVIQLRRDNVEPFLQLLDSIDRRFTQLASSGLDLRPEQTRWNSLQGRLQREAGRVMRAADAAGGLASLRARNAPAQGLWWHLDAVAAADRRRSIRRLGAAIGTAVASLALIWSLFTFVIPADANSVITSEAITELRQLAFEARWEHGLAVIEEAKALLTEPNAELLIWEAVVRGKLGQDARAEEALDEAKALVPADRQVSFWWTLGMVRLDIGDLEEARAAGREALALDASDPQGYFLLGNVAEVEGDVPAAIELFEKSYQLALESGANELAVIARIRMGTLLQRPAGIPLFDEDQPDANENAD
jgi:tetratricopeptide (TPR) repeat protein